MSLLHSLQSPLTDEGLCRACDNAQWFEGRAHHCADSACACLTCHPATIDRVRAVFDALDELLAINVPRPRLERRKHRIATPA